jgi:hypothetical protein
MNPPLECTAEVFLRCELSYTSALWKRTISATFHAVFLILEPQSTAKTAIFALPALKTGRLCRFCGVGQHELVISKRGFIARESCCAGVEEKQIPPPMNLASE